MHESSKNLMKQFVDKYLKDFKCGAVLDVGSYDVNGTYKDLFDERFKYTGLDIESGPNVDIVLPSPYDWSGISIMFDVVVSGQAFEHIPFWWLTLKYMAKVLTPGGLMAIIVPRHAKPHRHPVDCYRFLEGGMAAMAQYVGFQCLESIERGIDSMLIARKPDFWPGMPEIK